MIFYYYGINSAQAEYPISFLLCFRGLNDVIMTCKFKGEIFWKEEDLGAKEASKRRPEGRKRVAHVARCRGRVGPSIFALVAPLPSILLPEASS